MVGSIAKSVQSTLFGGARIVASFSVRVAIFVVGTVIVRFTFGSFNRYAVTSNVQPVTVFNWTHAVSTLVDD